MHQIQPIARSRPTAARLLLALALLVALLPACGLTPGSPAAPVASPEANGDPSPEATAGAARGPAATATRLPPPAGPSPTVDGPTPAPTPTPGLKATQTPPATGPSAAPGAAGIGDPYFPQMGNGGYDALHYDLTLEVNPAAQQIAGLSLMQARASQALSAFQLDFEQLTIDELLVDGLPAEYEHDGDQLLVTPARPLPAGAEFNVQVRYRGRPSPSNDPAVLSGWFWTAGLGTVAAEPFGAQTWFPANDHPLDKATYRLQVTVPRPLVVASNGLLVEIVAEGDALTYVWQARHPIASYLVTVSIDEYEMHETVTPDGLPLVSFAPPAELAALETAAAATASMIGYFEDLFGPYPFEAYGLVAVQGRLPGFAALETQTRSLFFDVPLTEDLLAHELAHQWFGDSVSLETWQDLWLKEGVATYAEFLWQERSAGRAAIDQAVAALHEEMVRGARAGFYEPPGMPSPGDLYGFPVYQGGAVFLHALRTRIGDEAFFETLQTYTQRFAYANAGTADLLAVAEGASGQYLSDFFQAWLYESPPPDLPGPPAAEEHARLLPSGPPAGDAPDPAGP